MPLILSGDTGVPASGMPTGSVIQTLSVTKTDTFSSSSTSFIDITGFSVSITPISTSSKILIVGVLTASTGLQNTITGYAQLVRNSTAIGNGADGLATQNAADGNFTTQWAFNFLDSQDAVTVAPPLAVSEALANTGKPVVGLLASIVKVVGDGTVATSYS